MKNFILPFFVIVLLSSCNTSGNKQPFKKAIALDSFNNKKSDPKKLREYRDIQFIKSLKPIWGYRFVLQGDFDGDKKRETLSEQFICGINRRDTNKFYQYIDYDRLVYATVHKCPVSFMTSSNKNIDTLNIADDLQLFGIAYAKNEGDLDGDGGDEVSYVVYWADWSSMNSVHIASYKNKKWKELYSFETRDWKLPDLPEVQNNYYLFGVSGINSTIGNDTLNQRLKRELDTFPGLIKKIGNGKIKVQTLVEAEDSLLTIDLDHPPKEE